MGCVKMSVLAVDFFFFFSRLEATTMACQQFVESSQNVFFGEWEGLQETVAAIVFNFI